MIAENCEYSVFAIEIMFRRYLVRINLTKYLRLQKKQLYLYISKIIFHIIVVRFNLTIQL